MTANLLAQHNFTEAEALAKDHKSSNSRFKPGESVVEIKHINDEIMAIHPFLTPLVNAIHNFFDCICVNFNDVHTLRFCFLGISKNSAAAVIAFEMCFNLIMKWAFPKKGKEAKESYSYGVALGLYKLARTEKEKAEEVRKKEKEQSQLVLFDPLKVAEDF